MGLTLVVGILADLVAADPEAVADYKATFHRLNKVLRARGLPVHHEPEECEAWSCDMYGYSGLHYLRRLAAHTDLRGTFPEPGTRDAADDPELQRYSQLFLAEATPLAPLTRWFRKPARRTFDHLMLHGDAEGFYVPLDFAEVLFPGEPAEIPGGMVGSSHRLLAECKRLATALEIPPDLDEQSEEIWKATESQGKGETLWQRYGIESYSCVCLLKACEHSLATGAAIVFT